MDGLGSTGSPNVLAQAMLLTAAMFYDCGHSRITGAHLADQVDRQLRRQLATLPGSASTASPSSGGATGAAGRWPTTRRDGPPALYVWLGASFMDYPEWAACDATAQWCLLGGKDRHTLVKVKGLSVVGTVDPDVADPRAALARLGVPAASIAEILRRRAARRPRGGCVASRGIGAAAGHDGAHGRALGPEIAP
jgi:hypothetical protein